MTREEAIKWLKTFKGRTGMAELSQAFGVAIEALEQQSVLDKIRAEIDSYCSDNRDRNDGLYIAMRIIDKYKAERREKEWSSKKM